MTQDPFWKLPAEVIVEIIDQLTCKETFRWRSVSVPINLVAIPHRIYRRFTKHEMAFMPTFIKQLTTAEASEDRTEIHWKNIFEQASTEWRHDDGLRNRRRIWKILNPMAEELMERSPQRLKQLGYPSRSPPRAITVARGSVGLTSSAEGFHETTLFAKAGSSSSVSGSGTPSATNDATASSGSSSLDSGGSTSSPSAISSNGTSGSLAPQDFVRSIKELHVWLDPLERHVRGIEFGFQPDAVPTSSDVAVIQRRFGTRTSIRETHHVKGKGVILTGFNVSWYLGSLRGIQFVFEDASRPPTEYAEDEYTSREYGTWHGPKRRLVAPRSYRCLAGVTGFINTKRDIETFAILEEKISLPVNDGEGFLIPPDTVPLSHQEASMWSSLPPNDIDLLERQGPVVEGWRLKGAEHEIFARSSSAEPFARLESISVYAMGDYLCGFQFTYAHHRGEVTANQYGTCEGAEQSRLTFSPGEEISAVVMSHGPGGIHSVQVGMIPPGHALGLKQTDSRGRSSLHRRLVRRRALVI
jgi:hypothetical protein